MKSPSRFFLERAKGPYRSGDIVLPPNEFDELRSGPLQSYKLSSEGTHYNLPDRDRRLVRGGATLTVPHVVLQRHQQVLECIEEFSQPEYLAVPNDSDDSSFFSFVNYAFGEYQEPESNNPDAHHFLVAQAAQELLQSEVPPSRAQREHFMQLLKEDVVANVAPRRQEQLIKGLVDAFQDRLMQTQGRQQFSAYQVDTGEIGTREFQSNDCELIDYARPWLNLVRLENARVVLDDQAFAEVGFGKTPSTNPVRDAFSHRVMRTAGLRIRNLLNTALCDIQWECDGVSHTLPVAFRAYPLLEDELRYNGRVHMAVQLTFLDEQGARPRTHDVLSIQNLCFVDRSRLC